MLVKLFAFLAVAGVYLWGDHLTGWHFLAIWALPLFLILQPSRLRKTVKLNLIRILIIILLVHLFIRLTIIKPQINLPYYFYYPNVLISLDNFSDWFSLQEWVKLNTPIASTFLIPPNLLGFRNFSERSIVVDVKDGGLAFYSPGYAREWQQRINDVANYDQLNQEGFVNLSKKYDFQYIIVESNHQQLTFPLVYQNKKFLIYKM